MQISLQKPDLVKFVQGQVAEGHFDSPEEVIEAALLRLRSATVFADLDPETLATLRASREELDRGEGRDFREALGELRRKFEQR
jgi:Arc/MetJ-type ribon-helix-helix transcriptional regulator